MGQKKHSRDSTPLTFPKNFKRLAQDKKEGNLEKRQFWLSAAPFLIEKKALHSGFIFQTLIASGKLKNKSLDTFIYKRIYSM